MRKSRFSEAQIVSIFREFDAGTPSRAEPARRHGIHANYPVEAIEVRGISASDPARLKQLEA